MEVGENGQNSEGIVLQPATEFGSLVVLLRKIFTQILLRMVPFSVW